MSTWARRRFFAATSRRLNEGGRPVSLEFAERIRRIPVYPVAAGYDLGDDVAMLASNESPYAPLPAVIEAAQRAVAGVNRYPDPSYSPLRQALADRYGVPPARIAL